VSCQEQVPWRNGRARRLRTRRNSRARLRRGAGNGIPSLTERGAPPWLRKGPGGRRARADGARTMGRVTPCVTAEGTVPAGGNHPMPAGWFVPPQTDGRRPAPRGSLVPSPVRGAGRRRAVGGGDGPVGPVEGEAAEGGGDGLSLGGRRAGMSGDGGAGGPARRRRRGWLASRRREGEVGLSPRTRRDCQTPAGLGVPDRGAGRRSGRP